VILRPDEVKRMIVLSGTIEEGRRWIGMKKIGKRRCTRKREGDYAAYSVTLISPMRKEQIMLGSACQHHHVAVVLASVTLEMIYDASSGIIVF
jgi:hypothetical protein